MSNYRYILRYYIDPGFHEEDRIGELIGFCREAMIDEVMLFFNAEEMNSGHYTMEELLAWLPMAKRIKSRLGEAGVDMSVNPWTTTVHSPRARKLKPGQNFTLMVGDTGKDNGVTACPLCPEWRKYLIGLWTVVAQELQPVTIWLEDDLRYHNHGSVMGKGGCYCELHLREFSRLVGREVSRTELLAAVFGAGDPHPWRQIWFDLNARSISDPMREIREVLVRKAPGTRLALMCGGIDAAGAEGRHWHQLQDAVGFEPAFMVRPTMSPYTEVWSIRKYPVQARMVVASLKRPLEIYPELESGPRNGAYSKGCGYAGLELMGTACFGAHGITMNHYDMMGCGIALDTRFGKMLNRIKPQLNAIKALSIDDNDSLGANILFSPAAAAKMQSTAAGGMHGVVNASGEWGNLASILGFSYRYSDKAELSSQPCLIGDQTPWAFSDAELRELLKGTIVLDGKAASIMIERGFGNELGITDWRLRKSRDVPYSYEEICESDPSVYDLAFPRMTAQRAAQQIFEFTPAADSEVLSRICRYDHTRLFPGCIRHKTSFGGTAVTLAYWLGDQGMDEWYYMGFFSPFRRIFMQRLLWSSAKSMRAAFVEELPFQCYRAKCANGEFIAALNASTDPAEKMTMKVTGIGTCDYQLLGADGLWQSGKLDVRNNTDGSVQLTYRDTVGVHEGVFILATPKN